MASWSSAVVKHDLHMAHGAVGIDADRIVYELSVTLATPLPTLETLPCLSLSAPLGGLWRVKTVSPDRRSLQCEAWRRTTMTRADLAQAREEFEQKLAAGGAIGTLFEWTLVRGAWGRDDRHWCLRAADPTRTQLEVRLFTDLAPLEAQIEVNAITAVDTVGQTFNADVTWQVTLPGITVIAEDSVLRELLDLLELDADAFEITNVNSMQDEKPLATSITPAGDIQFVDRTETVYHLQFSRRVIATFSEEMTLHHFPFDQQKLTFDLLCPHGVVESPVRLTPAPVDPGRFAVDNFRLGNVFDVVCHDLVFVVDVHDDGPMPSVSFGLLLERKSGYYLTNVALIAAAITYLSFITYAPVNGDELMDTGARLQIVLTLVLTAVTFKNQVASLIPQVSYFTSLDKYVFFCFLVTCAVTIENALFPLWATVFASHGVWKENSLLGISLGVFTLVNVAWAVYLRRWVAQRRRRIESLLEVHEYIRVITTNFPAPMRDRVLHEFLMEREFDDARRPPVLVTRDGDLHIQLPDDAATHNHSNETKLHAVEANKQKALTELSAMHSIYARLHPGDTTAAPATARVIPATRPNAAYETEVGRSRGASNAAARRSAHGRASVDSALESPPVGDGETTVIMEPFHRHHERRFSDAAKQRRAV